MLYYIYADTAYMPILLKLLTIIDYLKGHETPILKK